MYRHTRGVAVALLSLAPLTLSAVTPVMIGGDLIQPAHPFDLHGRTLRFSPVSQSYNLENDPLNELRPRGNPLPRPDFPSGRSNGWRVAIPFDFPFGGKTYRELFVNQAGNLTFDRPEAQLYPERDTWAAGTMRSVHNSLAVRSIASAERMIAAFWGLNAATSPVFVQSSAAQLVVTWQTERYKTPNEGYGPLGPNLFQATLFPTGVIELSYSQISELDGIVGVFPGSPAASTRLDLLTDRNDDAPDPRIEIESVEASDAGDALRFSFLTTRNILQSAPEGTLWYRVFLRRAGWNCEIGLWVDTSARGYSGLDCGGTTVFPRIQNNRLELSVLKSSISPSPGLRWNADILWNPRPGTSLRDDAGTRDLPLSPTSFDPLDFTTSTGILDGNIAEVFHYPSVSKNVAPHLRYIYRIYQPQEELVAVFFDFRIDDLHNHQPTSTPLNTPIRGLGGAYANPPNGAQTFASTQVAAATGPIFLGPRFSEFVEDAQRKYKNWAFGVGWVAHEFTHRWGAALLIQNPNFQNARALLDTSCFCHWNEALDTRSINNVWQQFSDAEYPERSTLDGGFLDEQPDGTFRRRNVPYLVPFGYSSLDLYILGLIPPSEVAPTFFLQNMQAAGAVIRGVKQTIRIEDIVAGSGQRVPNAQQSPKEFTYSFYLMHENGRLPDIEKLAQAEGIEKNLREWFRIATGGRAQLSTPALRLRLKPASLKAISGADQKGAPNELLAAPLIVEVADDQGFPLPGLSASIETQNLIAANTQLTNALGQLSIPIQLGDMAGEASLTIRIEGLEPLLLRFPVE